MAKQVKFTPAFWLKIKEQVIEWAGSDRGSDDLANVLEPYRRDIDEEDRFGPDDPTSDAFWAEFQARLAKAFGGKS